MTNITILLVEDDAELRALYKYIFTSEGYTILEAYDGPRAVELYIQHHQSIHLVLMDLGLPTLDGKEVFKMLKEINSNVKVVFVSGYLDEQLSAELIRAGAAALIRKPYSPESIVHNVRELLLGNKV